MANRIRLGELLVRTRVIDEMQLKAALAEQHRWGGRLGKILVDMAFVSEEILVKALSKQLGVERADLTQVHVPDVIMSKVSAEFAETNGLCPVRYDDGRRVLVVATADPTNVGALDELRFKTGLRIETALAGEHEIRVAIQRYLRGAVVGGIELPDAIELADDSGRSVLIPNDDHSATMGASGIKVSPGRPGGAIPAPARTPRQGSVVPAPVAPAPPPVLGARVPSPQIPTPKAQPALGVPLAAGHAAAPRNPSTQGSAMEMADRLEGAQKQQHKALRVMVELLIEKGVISREEYLARVTQAGNKGAQ